MIHGRKVIRNEKTERHDLLIHIGASSQEERETDRQTNRNRDRDRWKEGRDTEMERVLSRINVYLTSNSLLTTAVWFCKAALNRNLSHISSLPPSFFLDKSETLSMVLFSGLACSSSTLTHYNYHSCAHHLNNDDNQLFISFSPSCFSGFIDQLIHEVTLIF